MWMTSIHDQDTFHLILTDLLFRENLRPSGPGMPRIKDAQFTRHLGGRSGSCSNNRGLSLVSMNGGFTMENPMKK